MRKIIVLLFASGCGSGLPGPEPVPPEAAPIRAAAINLECTEPVKLKLVCLAAPPETQSFNKCVVPSCAVDTTECDDQHAWSCFVVAE